MIGVQISNAERVVFPEAGYTKGDVVAHYERVGRAMLPFVADRPLTLQRFPKGLAGQGFMQKNAPAHYPDAIDRFVVPKRGGGSTAYPVINDEGYLPYLANQGTITFHMGTSTATNPDQPDFLIIDLDPIEGDAAGARALTLAVHDLLADHGVESAPMATGSKGYHVWVPLVPGHSWTELGRTGRAVAGIVVARHPDRATMEFLKRERHGRVFVDWLRNLQGATVVAPYSLRARPQAPVAVPLVWSELDTTAPDHWTLAGIQERLSSPAVLPAAQQVPVQQICEEALSLGVDLEARFDRFGRT